MSIKNSNDTIGNRTHDLPPLTVAKAKIKDCSAKEDKESE